MTAASICVLCPACDGVVVVPMTIALGIASGGQAIATITPDITATQAHVTEHRTT